MKSLQGRLHWGLGASLVVLMAFVGWFVQMGISQISRDMLASRLEHDAQAILASLQISSGQQPVLDVPRLGNIYNQVFSGHYYEVSIDGKLIRSRSLWDYSLAIPEFDNGNASIGNVPGPDGQILLQWTKHFERFGMPVVISVAEDVTPLQAAIHRFNLYFALGAIGMLVVLLITQAMIVRRSLSSVRGLKKQVQALSEGDISELSGQMPSEIQPLVEEVNHLLHLLAQRLQRSRNAVGNLAHGLKHPLNLLMQLSVEEGIKNQPELAKEIGGYTGQIRQIVERELKRARLSGRGTPGQRFSAAQEIPDLVDVLKRVYRDRKLHIRYEVASGLIYAADRNDMLELLGNLLDNACKWANSIVSVKLWSDHGLNILVEDDGSGCDHEQMQYLEKRGVKADEADGGSGLGLTIVNEIVDLYQGDMVFSRSELGGLAVAVMLPRPGQNEFCVN
jgi:signal transduction histidine kinase